MIFVPLPPTSRTVDSVDGHGRTGTAVDLVIGVDVVNDALI
jgi:hypothetical protein